MYMYLHVKHNCKYRPEASIVWYGMRYNSITYFKQIIVKILKSKEQMLHTVIRQLKTESIFYKCFLNKWFRRKVNPP